MVLDRLVARLAGHTPARATEFDRPTAAVALILASAPDQMLLIRRAERAGDPWSGHLALPGGRRQSGDAGLLDTAIRETAEETGIVLERACRVAELDDLVPRTPTLPPIVVRPFVFLLAVAAKPGLSSEVVQSMWVPFDRLTRSGMVTRTVEVRGVARDVEGYQLAAGFLWGMTERIVTPVLRLWKEESGQDDRLEI
ncbi:MAG TPA: CoA pyrophosphatase [Gemmatimonadales bacterium]|jgi:8-oxo-dGTP pyrophosphatase MutT (NUDIX family)